MNQAFINGFVKRAQEYGIAENHALELSKQADVNGPYSVDHASKVKADDERLKGLVSNRKNHLMHYLLNPFVGGPLTEAITRLSRRSNAARTGKGGWGYDAASMISPIGSGVASLTYGGREENRIGARQIASKNNLNKYHTV
jgi:hypothetical protein